MAEIRAELVPLGETAPNDRSETQYNHYTWGETLGFGLESRNQGFLKQGWSYAETNGVWSEDRTAVFAAEVVPTGEPLLLAFRCAPFLPLGLSSQRVFLVAGGTNQGEWVVQAEGELHGLLRLPATSKLRLEFHFPNARSPAAAGLSADPRTLGVRLQQLTLSPLP